MAEPESWIKVSDIVIAAATLLGPIFAVQVQKLVERRAAIRQQKSKLFSTLMATRATNIAPDRVAALNAIVLEFGQHRGLLFRRQSRADGEVTQAYRLYFDKLCEPAPQEEQSVRIWNDQCNERYVDLLFSMAQNLGYDFDKVQIKNSIYRPRGHVEEEAAMRAIKDRLAHILTGNGTIPIKVTAIEGNAEVMAAQAQIQTALFQLLSGQTTLKVDLNAMSSDIARRSDKAH
jgi:hypothetical protein